MLKRKQFESLTPLTSQNFDQLFGKEGLKLEDSNTQKVTMYKMTIKKPKLKKAIPKRKTRFAKIKNKGNLMGIRSLALFLQFIF